MPHTNRVIWTCFPQSHRVSQFSTSIEWADANLMMAQCRPSGTSVWWWTIRSLVEMQLNICLYLYYAHCRLKAKLIRKQIHAKKYQSSKIKHVYYIQLWRNIYQSAFVLNKPNIRALSNHVCLLLVHKGSYYMTSCSIRVWPSA